MIEDTLMEDTLEIRNKSDNKEIVKKYLDKWYTYRDSKMLEQEYALSTLFQHFYQKDSIYTFFLSFCFSSIHNTYHFAL